MAMFKKREEFTENNDNNTMFAMGLTDSFGDLLLVTEEETDDIDAKIEEVMKMDLAKETKYKIINEYNNLRKARSFREKIRYENNIKKLLKK